MSNTQRDTAIAQIKRKLDPAELKKIRRLWMDHSVAEDKRDIPGLMATLTDDCVYTVVATDTNWRGKEGATQFYHELLGAFPDVHFDLMNIVIGPQGVVEEAEVTGTHTDQWLHFPPTGKKITWKVVIWFPWDHEHQLFKGERIYIDNDAPFRGE
jgi:predicted ester cyclase